MNLTGPDEQTLISGFHNEASPESERISCLTQLAEIDELKAIELITEGMKRKPALSFMKSVLGLLPGMKCDQAHQLMNYYLQYLLKPDAALIPHHTEMLASALKIMTEFKRPEYTDAIISAYTCFSNDEKQDAIIKSGVFEKLLSGPLTDQQKAEILLITGDTDKIPASISREDFAAACHKIIRKHASLRKIASDLKSVKKRGDMELYQKLKEENKNKLMPEATRKVIFLGIGVLIVTFIIFYFLFIFHKPLTSVQIANKITGFFVTAFSAIAILGTLALIRYKNN
ncbi:MAG TPA: hypothetical protein PLP69_05440 [Bacteroidales bacterium]|nr:hypothetical protein [Bacteroidales bacterium]